MVSMYIVDFLLILKTYKLVNWIKERLNSKYNVEDLGEFKTIIRW